MASSFFQIEAIILNMDTFTIMLIAGEILIIALLIAILLKRKGNNDESSYYRMQQELQDRLSSSFDSFRLSMETRIQGIEKQMTGFSDSVRLSIDNLRDSEKKQMELFFTETRAMNNRLADTEKESAAALRVSIDQMRTENSKMMEKMLKESADLIEKVRLGLDSIRNDNNQQLEKIRGTVDEKLQKTLETRLTASFGEVTKNLEALYKSIGEMNSLAKDVSSINKMFSNVKVRGTWGEVQAETILSDMLTPAQYVKNYSPGRSGGTVEFAIRLPGKEEGSDVFLPIDSKFPKEDFVRYSEAAAEGDEAKMQQAIKDLKARVMAEARDIRDKYIVPPKTTDFAILFVPTESLYAELLRISGFVESLQENYKVVLTGPTNFSALINSLQIGFRTLQVERNTERIWKLFRDLKTQFYRFGDDLEKSQRALESATGKIEAAVKRSNTITGKLERIELPDSAGDEFLENAAADSQLIE